MSTASYDWVEYGNFSVSSAVLLSDYPYIALDSTMWAQAKADLQGAGFLCFDEPFSQKSHCTGTSMCSSYTDNLPDISIIFSDALNTTTYNATIEPEFYLLTDYSTGNCMSLLSEAVTGKESFMLGAPFFR